MLSEVSVYEGRLCTVKREGKMFNVKPATGSLLYERGELLVEVQMIMAAILLGTRT